MTLMRGLARYGKGGVWDLESAKTFILYCSSRYSRIGDENVVQKILYGGNDDLLYE